MNNLTEPTSRTIAWQTIGAEDISGLDPSDALAKAGLIYKVNSQPLRAAIEPYTGNPILPRGQDIIVEIPNRKTVIREDTNEILGTVGNRYEIIQNESVLPIIEALIGAGWEPRWGGTRGNGYQAFMIGKLPYEMRSLPGVSPYMGFINSFDGSTALRLTSLLVVPSCTNALGGLGRRNTNSYGFKHTPNIWNRIDEARDALGLQLAWAERFDAEIAELQRESLTATEGEHIIRRIVPMEPAYSQRGYYNAQPGDMVLNGKILSERAANRRSNRRVALKDNWLNSETILESTRFTKWGLIQGISEYEQHRTGDRKKKANTLVTQHTKGRMGALTTSAWKVLASAEA